MAYESAPQRWAKREIDRQAQQIARLEDDRDHELSLDEWARLLSTAPPPHDDSHLPSADATDPTNACPQTPAKIDVMQGRAARGENLFSPDDADMGEHNDRMCRVAVPSFRGKDRCAVGKDTTVAVHTHQGVTR